MRQDALNHLVSTSTIAEVPGWYEVLDLEDRARRLAELFHDLPSLPGVLLTHEGRVQSAISRRYYLEMVGSYCGKDLYLSRPIGLMMAPFDRLGGPLSVTADLPIGAAVGQGLARRRELIYEPLIVRPGTSTDPAATTRLVDFEDLLIANSRLSALRNSQMRQILGSVGEGLLLIQPDRRIAAEYSASAEVLLATRQIADQRLEELLAPRLNAESCRLAAEFVDILFRPSVIENLVASLNPLAKVTIHNPGEALPRIVTCRFLRELDGRHVRHLLLRIEDVTRQEEQAKALARERENTERRLGLAIELAEADPTQVRPFLDALELQCQAARSLSRGPATETSTQRRALARELHALKGEAGLLGMNTFRITLHQLETALENGTPDGVLGSVEALSREARELIVRFRRLGGEDRPPRAAEAERPRPSEKTGRSEPTEQAEPSGLAALLGQLSRQVQKVAAEVGKQARFVSRVEPGLLPEGSFSWLREVLPQLAINAVAHGIESPEVRVAAGKPATGTLMLAARAHPASRRLEVVFQDDGAGLDLDRLRKRAQALGLAARSAEEIGRLVFEPGFSTAESATVHAGRGVGLDLVKTRVEAEGGRVALVSEPGRLCAVRLLLPLAVEVAA